MTRPEYAPGIYNDVSNEDYHRSPGVSKSGLDLIAKSPYLYRNRPSVEPTKAMVIGSATHCAVLEPQKFPHLFACAPDGINQRTNAGKAEMAAFMAENEGKTVLAADDYETVVNIEHAVRSHELAANILGEGGEAETSIFHQDEITEELVKVRPDWMVEDLLVDLKTTEDASPDAFSKACFNYRYFVQAAMYLDIANAQIGFQRFNSFVFVAVEKKPPFQVAVYFADPQMIEAGRVEYRRNLATYHRCKTTGIWPGYGEGKIQPISLPGWALRQLDVAICD